MTDVERLIADAKAAGYTIEIKANAHTSWISIFKGRIYRNKQQQVTHQRITTGVALCVGVADGVFQEQAYRLDLSLLLTNNIPTINGIRAILFKKRRYKTKKPKTLTEVMCGPKRDGSSRPMYFKVENGKKRRISESDFNSGLDVRYVQVPWSAKK